MAGTLLLPNSELVARAWLATIPGITGAMVGTLLPRISESVLPGWAATGFLTVAVVGGSPHAYVPLAQPAVSVNCWAVAATQALPGGPVTVSNKPPWGKANQLAELVRQAVDPLQRGLSAKQVSMPVPGYGRAAVRSALMLTEPRRLPSDVAAYARFQFELLLHWSAEAVG